MKKQLWILAFLIFITFCFSGCRQNDSSYSKEDLQRLTQLEVYKSDGTLLSTITDTDILYQFNNTLNDIELPEYVSENKETETMKALVPSYIIISYKTPASIITNGELEKSTELTLFDNSNIIKEYIAPENIKNMPISPEDLTYYPTASDEQIQFFLSLTEK